MSNPEKDGGVIFMPLEFHSTWLFVRVEKIDMYTIDEEALEQQREQMLARLDVLRQGFSAILAEHDLPIKHSTQYVLNRVRLFGRELYNTDRKKKNK